MKFLNIKVLFASVGVLFFVIGCNYPEPVSSTGDLKRLPADTKQLRFVNLSTNAYPELRKFTNLLSVDFYNKNKSGAMDSDLRALGNVGDINIEGIGLLNCYLVTDDGIESLAQIKSLKWLQLEGTSISDEGLKTIAEKMNLDGLNVTGTKVTLDGLKVLADAKSLRGLGFSSRGQVSEEVCDVIKTLRQVTRFDIIDHSLELDTNKIQQCAENTGAQVVIQSKGALDW